MALPCFDCNGSHAKHRIAAKEPGRRCHSHSGPTSDLRINHTAGTSRACWWLMPNLEPTNGSRRTTCRSKWLSGPMSRCHAVSLPHPWRSRKSSDRRLAVRGRANTSEQCYSYSKVFFAIGNFWKNCCCCAASTICLGHGTRPIRWIISRFGPVVRPLLDGPARPGRQRPIRARSSMRSALTREGQRQAHGR